MRVLRNQVASPSSWPRTIVGGGGVEVVMVFPPIVVAPVARVILPGAVSDTRHCPGQYVNLFLVTDSPSTTSQAILGLLSLRAVEHLRAGQAGPALARVVLAPRRAQALRRAQAARRRRPGLGRPGDDRSPAAHRVHRSPARAGPRCAAGCRSRRHPRRSSSRGWSRCSSPTAARSSSCGATLVHHRRDGRGADGPSSGGNVEEALGPEPAFPERQHLSSLGVRFHLDHEQLVADWARWALVQTEEWVSTTDPGDWDPPCRVRGPRRGPLPLSRSWGFRPFLARPGCARRRRDVTMAAITTTPGGTETR